MKDSIIEEFVECIHYEDRVVCYNDKNYYFNGCSCETNKLGEELYTFEIYLLNEDGSGETIFSVQGSTSQECIGKFLSARLFNGKTFYEVEKDMTEIDL